MAETSREKAERELDEADKAEAEAKKQREAEAARRAQEDRAKNERIAKYKSEQAQENLRKAQASARQSAAKEMMEKPKAAEPTSTPAAEEEVWVRLPSSSFGPGGRKKMKKSAAEKYIKEVKGSKIE